jgi:hypothetical protein
MTLSSKQHGRKERQSLKHWLASFLDGLLDRLPVL